MSEHELWNELGNLYFMSGAYDQAIFAYHRSIQLDGDFGRPYSNLALAYVQQGKYEEAIELYRRSLELLADNKEKAISWSRLGNVYRHLKNYQQAVVAYQQADEIDPEGSGYRTEPDRVLYGSSDPAIQRPDSSNPENSITEERPAVPAADTPGVEEDVSSPNNEVESRATVDVDEPGVMDPSETESQLDWADLATEEDPDLALFFETDTEIYYPELDGDTLADWLPIPEPLESSGENSEGIPAQNREGIDMQKDGDPAPGKDDAAHNQVFQPWLPANPLLTAKINRSAEEDYSFSAGSADTGEQKLRMVEIDFEEPPAATFVVPEHMEEQAIQAGVGSESDGSGDTTSEEVALNIELEIPKLKRLVQVNPRNAVTWNTLGNLYKTAGLYREAILAYQQATSLDPDKAEYYHNLGMVYGAEGRDEDAIIALQKVLELKPDHSLTHATLGGYYQKMGLDELAQKHIGKAMKHIYDSESEYNRACLEAICGNTDQAIELLRVALENKQTYVDWVLRDPDLDMIREDRRFKQLISDFT